MTTTEAILNYASRQRGVFLRKDLLRNLTDNQTNITEGAVDLQLSRFIASGRLLHKGRGKYLLAENNLPEFVYQPSEVEKEIFLKLKARFPLLDICIWSPKALSRFMLHIPCIGYTFVDVEKDGMEPVFHALQDMDLGRNILFAPSAKDCERYLTGTDAIVVRPLVGQSPLAEVDGSIVPRIEKMLVDAVSDNELLFAGGSEIYNLYENARERNNVSLSKLMRYASRRNRKEKVRQIIDAINHDKSKEQVR